MQAAKETLHETVDLLNEKETRQVLEFAKSLRKQDYPSQTLQQLEDDATFKLPPSKKFQNVKPISGKGIAASHLLVQERR